MASLTWTFLYHFPFFNRSWLWLLIGCIVSYFVITGYYNSKSFKYVFIYSLLVVLNVLLDDSYFNSLPLAMSEIAGLILVSSEVSFFLLNQNNKYYSILLFVFFSIIVITAYLSYQIDTIWPGAIREVTVTGFGGDNTVVSQYYAMGMGSYAMSHALPVIIPPLIMGIKYSAKKWFSKLGCIFCLVAVIVYIYLGSASGALIIGMMSLVLSIFVKPGSLGTNISRIIVITILFLLFLNQDFLLFVLDWFESFIGGEGAYQVKVDEFRMLITTGEQGDDINARLNLYSDSWSDFLVNFVWGTNGEIGGHSAIIDRFATLGIIGIVPFLIFMFKQLHLPTKFIDNNYLVYYYIGTFSGLLMLMTKNMGNWEMWLCLFLILPLLMARMQPRSNKNTPDSK